MAGRLLRSWIRLTLVWWVGVAIAWAFSDVRIGSAIHVLNGSSVVVNPGNSGHLALSVLRRWSLPVAIATALCAGLGWFMAWGAHKFLRRKRDSRVLPGVAWRGLKISLGPLESPAWLPDRQQPFTAEVSSSLAQRINQLSPPHRAVLNEVLGYLAAHPEAFVGAGHQGTLLDHSLHVLERLPKGNEDSLALIATAAHDAGKVLAWQRNAEGTWERKGNHDDMGGLLLYALPAAAKLSESELRVLVLALRFAHKRERTPVLHDATERARVAAIQDAVSAADREATSIEKKAVLAEVDRPKLLETAFLTALPDMLFQVHGLPKGTLAAAWRKDGRVYFSEPRLREVIGETLRTINADAAAAWQETRQKGRVVQQTLDLIALFRQKGWLVEEIEGVRAAPPLWNVLSGTKQLRGIIIVDLPEHMHYMLPANAPYQLTVTGALLNDGEIPLPARKAKPEAAPASPPEAPVATAPAPPPADAEPPPPPVAPPVPEQAPSPPPAPAATPSAESGPTPQPAPPSGNKGGKPRRQQREPRAAAPPPPAPPPVNHKKPSSKAAMLALMSGNAISERSGEDDEQL